MEKKLHRRIIGHRIYNALQGWGDVYDSYEYRQDTASEDGPQGEPEATTSGNEHNAPSVETCPECFQRTQQCIRIDLFPEGECEQLMRRNRCIQSMRRNAPRGRLE